MKKILCLFFLIFLCNCSYKIIIRKDPLSAKEHNDLGAAYFKEKEFKAAEREFKSSIKKDKKYWLAYYNLGTLYLFIKNYKEAEFYLYKSIIYNPTFSDAYNNLAILMLKKGDYKHSLYYINLSFKYAINNKHLYYDTFAELQEQLNNKKEACKALRESIKAAPPEEKKYYEKKFHQKCN